MISRFLRAAPLAACVLLAGCGDGGAFGLGGAHWRLVENQDRLTGHAQNDAELSENLEGGGHVVLRAQCEDKPGAGATLRISGEISDIGSQRALEHVSQWRAVAGAQEGDMTVALTGENSFAISTAMASADADNLNSALLSSSQSVRAEIARAGDDPILYIRNADDAFQAIVRRCRLQAAQSQAASSPAPSPAPSAGETAAPSPQPAQQIAAPQAAVMVPRGAGGGPAPLPPGTPVRAPLPPNGKL